MGSPIRRFPCQMTERARLRQDTFRAYGPKREETAMTYRDILVHVSCDRRTAARLDAAIGLAERCEGQVTGVYVLPYPSLPTYAGTFEIPDDVLEDVSRHQRDRAADAERAFGERMAQTRLSSEGCESRMAVVVATPSTLFSQRVPERDSG